MLQFKKLIADEICWKGILFIKKNNDYQFSENKIYKCKLISDFNTEKNIVFGLDLDRDSKLSIKLIHKGFINNIFSPTHAVYSVIFGLLIIVFTYFYTAITFNPVDIADNMKKQGGFIPGVRPGRSTADYIDKILTRVTLPASIFLALVAIFPAILYSVFNQEVSYSLVSFYGGTSLIIIVGVALDTLQQIESHMLMRNYDGFLKSGRIRGRSRRY